MQTAHAAFFLTASAAAPQVQESYSNSQRFSLLRAPLHINPVTGRGGGTLAIDSGALRAPLGADPTSPDQENTNGSISIYVVRTGDTLSSVAEMFDVSPNTIRWANDMPDGTGLHVGQILVILPVDGVQYTVKQGDTVRGIAKKYGVDQSEIISFNDLLPGGTLVVGDMLIVPGAKEQTQRSTPKRTVQPQSTIQVTSGYFAWPVDGGRITQGIHGHNGKDIGAPRGTSVFAAANGMVVISRSGWNGGYGRMIVIQHQNGVQTLYAHLDAAFVVPGQSVYKGQTIGLVGSTGRSTGPHLHFETHGVVNDVETWPH